MRPSPDTLLVWTGASCSYGCAACPIDAAGALPGLAPAALQASLAAIPSRSGRLVVMLGGEPFLRRDLLGLLAVVRAAGCVPGLVTTGGALVYPQIREKLRRAGLGYLRVQLFGIGAAHDSAVAVPGGFEQALAGVRAWIDEAGSECDVDVALSLRSRQSALAVSDIEQLLRGMSSSDVHLVIAADPAAAYAAQEVEALRSVVTHFANWNDDASRPLLLWEGFPAAAGVTPASASAPFRPAFLVSQPRACCLGPVDALADVGSTLATCANSFNYLRTDTSVPYVISADQCSAHTATPAIDLCRQLWLVDDDRLQLYTTDTGDFGAAEIGRIKSDLSHLFVDRAAAGVLDDFTEGMRRVLPDPTCATCANRAHCGRRFQVIEGPPFASEEAWIASYIAGLRGHVLDVGCGEQLYLKELEPLVRSHLVHYTGLDPDQVSLQRLRSALPQGRFYLTGIEDFRDEPATYDHVLCLRSLNHVFDIDEGLARMTAMLKPGGNMLFVETTPFAMLRTQQQVAAADSAPRAGHQHLRNMASEELLPLARRRSLQVLYHHPASLQTSNEWILLLRRVR